MAPHRTRKAFTHILHTHTKGSGHRSQVNTADLKVPGIARFPVQAGMANCRAPSRSRHRWEFKDLGAIEHYFAEFEHHSESMVQSTACPAAHTRVGPWTPCISRPDTSWTLRASTRPVAPAPGQGTRAPHPCRSIPWIRESHAPPPTPGARDPPHGGPRGTQPSPHLRSPRDRVPPQAPEQASQAQTVAPHWAAP